jgi:2,3-dihydroxybiphenyl 1,2-dioxygenase
MHPGLQLGFLEFEVAQIDAWQSFLSDVCGLVAVEGDRYRMDGHAWRIQLREGPLDDLATVGWEFDEDTLDAAIARLRQAGHVVEAADPSARDAERRYTTVDPAGVPTELVTALKRADSPFQSPVVPTGFVGDELGLGHLVLTAPDPAATRAFYTKIMGMRISDYIRTTFFGHDVNLTFLHANPRHHTLAFGGPQHKRIEHFLFEVTDIDEVGKAYDRTIKAGHRIHLTMGRHPNDEMLSFYARTPSRFHFEFGWGGRQLDMDAEHDIQVFDRISDWGHQPPAFAFGRPT